MILKVKCALLTIPSELEKAVLMSSTMVMLNVSLSIFAKSVLLSPVKKRLIKH